MATLEVDPSFEVAIHTSYHNDFFLLRTRVLVNGENTEIRSVKEGKYEGPVLNFRHSGSAISRKLRMVASTVSPVLVQYGVYHVDTFYYEQSPLFHVVFSSESCLKNFILAIGEVKSALEPKLQLLFSSDLKTESAQQLIVEVQPDLFLVSPNRQATKGAELHLVTAENCSDFVTRWKNSKLFDFGSLYQEEAKPPQVTSQPTSHKDALPGKSVAFTVQATGTQPLNYLWQWKQFGRESEKDDGWQNLSGDSGTFQLKDVQASNAGYYRCVVSNSAGSETSQRGSLTVVPELCDLEGELRDVVDWISLGLRLGIKLPRLEGIKANCPTLVERRTQMLNEWQNNVIPTWSAVVKALVGIEMRRLASKLARKHGTPPPKLADDDPLDQLKNVPQEEATVSKLREDIQKLRSDLIQEHKKLVDAEESKIKANKEARDAAAKLEESHENVQKIVQEKKNLEMELKVKERECQLLFAMQQEKDEVFNQFLKMKVDEKEKEIKSLKEELQMKESGLQFAMQELQTQQEKLSKARKKLKNKHKEVMQLQKEKEELACSYNSEMEHVSKFVQITSSLTSDKEEMKQKLSIMEAESELKSQQIEVCSADINHLSEKIKALSSSLQKEEARAVQLQSELQARKQVASTQLLTFVKLTTQIAELESKLQEAEEQKQQAELERNATVQEMKVKESLKTQLHAQLDEPPKVTDQPKSLNKVSPGKPAMFTLQASGTEPLSYHWQWKQAEEEGGSEEWQPCSAEWSDGATLTIPSVQKCNEGSYRCVISNYGGTQTSNPAKLSIANPPRVTTHPQEMKDAVPGKPVRFTTVATGTQHLSYQWEWKPLSEAAEESPENEAWQPCNVERFPGADNSTITIPSVQKLNEGSYRCVVSNCAGSQASNPAELSVAEPPRITTHPQELKAVVQGKPANFTIQATGTEPLRYNWQWKPAEEEGEWQPCRAEWSDGAALTIPSVQVSNEGSYRCVISNCAGSQTSKPAKLETCPPLQLQLRWRRCRDMKYEMTDYPHCVVMDRTVYVGGGYTDYDDDDAHSVLKYNLDTDNWSRLPRYQYKYFAVSIINSRLTLVGGRDDRLKATNQLAVYEPSSQHWTYPYHPMPTPRYRPAVVMYDIWLLVAGGCAASYTDLATVELLNTSTNQWLAASSLPTPCSYLTSAIVDDHGYIVMNSKQVFRVSLPDIVSQTVDQSTASKSPALWRRLPDTPLSCSTAISLRGYLIAVGGRHDNLTTRTDIHLYQPESEQWTKVGDLPNARYYCSCVVLPSGELLVAGGQESYGRTSRTSRVDVASVLNHR